MEKFFAKQKELCLKYGIKYEPIAENELIAVAIDTIGKTPITGMRHFTEKDENISWYIYCGEFKSDDDFFKPVHFYHLIEILPEVLPYLALSHGCGFVIDDSGYEDVWYEGF